MISTKKQTRHVLLPLTNFTLDRTEPEFWKYDYCYLHLSDELLNDIAELLQAWLHGSIRHAWQCIPIKEPLILLTSAAVFEPTSESALGFEHIKLDSISFLASKPIVDGLDTKHAKAHLICDKDHFKIAAQRSPSGANYPELIYHSPAIPFQRIHQLLGNNTPARAKVSKADTRGLSLGPVIR